MAVLIKISGHDPAAFGPAAPEHVGMNYTHYERLWIHLLNMADQTAINFSRFRDDRVPFTNHLAIGWRLRHLSAAPHAALDFPSPFSDCSPKPAVTFTLNVES